MLVALDASSILERASPKEGDLMQPCPVCISFKHSFWQLVESGSTPSVTNLDLAHVNDYISRIILF